MIIKALYLLAILVVIVCFVIVVINNYKRVDKAKEQHSRFDSALNILQTFDRIGIDTWHERFEVRERRARYLLKNRWQNEV